MMCEMCSTNYAVLNCEDVKLHSLCGDCFEGSMYKKHYWILKFINTNAPKFLEHYYYRYITHAFEREQYFRKYGGDNWREKFESCKDYKYYKECLTSSIYKDELKQLTITAYNDLEQIIHNDEKDNIYKIEEYNDIYYTFEQFEICYRNIN